MLHNNLTVNEKGHLAIGGVDTVSLAEKYGTALYVMDEDKIRANCQTYLSAMKTYFPEGSMPLFASKALSFCRMYEIMKDVGMGTDLVSGGEVHTAFVAGFPMEKAFFHGNNKTDFDIRYAIECGVGYFVADNHEEIDAIDAIARERGIKQNVILRLTPGIDPHTHEAINTGKVDSKFGTAIETGQAEVFVGEILAKENINLCGFHCHVGSQIFDTQPFTVAADIMLAFIAKMKAHYNFTTEILNLGGGFGIRYTEKDPQIDITENIRLVSEHINASCAKFAITAPKIMLEPGRSIVADAGITLYTVGSVKQITGYKNYVSVDGGMPDNPRYALYQSVYTFMLANRPTDTADFPCTVAGRCCESGDLLGENVFLPKPVRGDVLAVLCTGAYNYAMASNYNRLPRPAVVMVAGGKDFLGVRRETFHDLVALDVKGGVSADCECSCELV